MVSFSKTAASMFDEKRIIPSDELKKIAFGSVTSIFTEKSSLQLLTFGNELEVASTLELLGCSTAAIANYHKKHRHLFSGMFDFLVMS